MRTARILAALAALTLICGCGSSPSSSTLKPATDPPVVDNTGWTVQVSRWNEYPGSWEIVIPGANKIYAGDTVDIDLVYGKVLGRGRGGYDLVKSVKLPDGTTIGNDSFGKGGFTLPQIGDYTFTVSASAAGQPHASLTVNVAKQTAWTPFDLNATSDGVLTLSHTIKDDGHTWFTGAVDQPIHFVLTNYGEMRGRGGLPLGETMLSIRRMTDGVEANYTLDANDRFGASIHQAGNYYVNMVFGTGGGGYANIATCYLTIQ